MKANKTIYRLRHMLHNKYRSAFLSMQVDRYILFLLAITLFGVAQGLFIGVQDNFLDWLGIGKSARGVVEFFRETPGLLLVFILSLFYRIAEQRIIQIAMVICAIGVTGMLLVDNQVILAVFFLVIYNLGDHLIMPVHQSYAIHAAKPGKEGRALGFMRGLSNLGKVVGTILVSAIFLIPRVQTDRDDGGRMGYTTTYVVILVFIGIAIVIALGMARSTESFERKRVYFHKKFNKYYILEIFYGGRKQVFLTFAPYLLILRYGIDVEYLAALLGVCALINILVNPLIGRLIDKIGYRNVMIADTIILFFVCLIYGFAHRIFNEQIALSIISVTFILDRMISNASIASSVYAGRISRNKEEMTSTLTTGLSVNHLVTILIALAGGVIWEKLGVEYLFSLAALMATANSFFAYTVSKE